MTAICIWWVCYVYRVCYLQFDFPHLPSPLIKHFRSFGFSTYIYLLLIRLKCNVQLLPNRWNRGLEKGFSLITKLLKIKWTSLKFDRFFIVLHIINWNKRSNRPPRWHIHFSFDQSRIYMFHINSRPSFVCILWNGNFARRNIARQDIKGRMDKDNGWGVLQTADCSSLYMKIGFVLYI